MFGISFEHIIIVGVILLLVGPRRLPELGNTFGKAIKNFKDSITGVEEASFKKINEQKTTSKETAQETPVRENPFVSSPVGGPFPNAQTSAPVSSAAASAANPTTTATPPADRTPEANA